jgi:Kef-type K+ transport system membrane component KefB
VFFVASGIRFDLGALGDSLAMVPLLLLALLVVRGLPALLYGLGRRETVVAGLLQATSLPFLVATTAIGLELALIGPGEAAALVGAGLISVLLFPAAALALLQARAAGTFSTT